MRYQVIGFNRDGSQLVLVSAPTLYTLLKRYAAKVARLESHPPSNYLPTLKRIRVWNSEDGFTSLEFPYIPTFTEVAA